MATQPIAVCLGIYAPGGIHTVIGNFHQHGIYDGYRYIRIVSNSGAGRAYNILVFLSALFKLLGVFLCNFRCKILVHAHMSMRGSFYRKLVFLLVSRAFGHGFILHIHGSEFVNIL